MRSLAAPPAADQPPRRRKSELGIAETATRVAPGKKIAASAVNNGGLDEELDLWIPDPRSQDGGSGAQNPADTDAHQDAHTPDAPLSK